MTSKKATLRRKRRERRQRERIVELEKMVAEMNKCIDWCLENVFIREEGVDRPVTVYEACEFIEFTSSQFK